MPKKEQLATVEPRLEAANARYIARNYASELGLRKTDIYEGQSCDPVNEESADRIIVEISMGGGEDANQGDYEVPLAIWIVTRNEEQPSDTRSPRKRHHDRVSVLGFAYSEEKKADVTQALMAIDPGLIVSSYWGYDREDHSTKNLLVSCLRKTFDCGLV